LDYAPPEGADRDVAPDRRDRVSRIKTKVQWIFVAANGLATDGKPRAFERCRKA